MNNLIKDDIKTSLSEFLKIPVGQINDAMQLKDMVRDSFMLVELLIELQEEYSIRLSQDDAEKIHTVADLTALVAERTKELEPG